MPLKHDLTEAKECNEFLANVLMEKPEMVCGSNGENTKNLLLMLADTLRRDCMEEGTIKKFGKFIKDLQNNEHLASTLTEVYNGLDDIRKKRIDNAVSVAN